MGLRRRLLALAALGLGALLVATTLSSAGRTAVDLRVRLVPGVRGLFLDVDREGRVVAHLEWSYAGHPPALQEAHLDLPPGTYQFVAHARGGGVDPATLELPVGAGEPVRAELWVR